MVPKFHNGALVLHKVLAGAIDGHVELGICWKG